VDVADGMEKELSEDTEGAAVLDMDSVDARAVGVSRMEVTRSLKSRMSR